MSSHNKIEQHPDEAVLLAVALGESSDTPIASHLASCSACSQRVHEFKEIRTALTTLDEEELPDGLQRKIAGEAVKSRWPVLNLFSLAHSYLTINASLAVLALLLAAIFFYIYFVFVI